MKTLKIYQRKHKYFTISARLNYFQMIKFRKLQKKHKLSPSELIKKFLGIREVNGN